MPSKHWVRKRSDSLAGVQWGCDAHEIARGGFLHPRNEPSKCGPLLKSLFSTPVHCCRMWDIFIFVLTCRCIEIHGKMAVLLCTDSPAGTKPGPAGSGTHNHLAELSYSSVTWVGGQSTRDWQKQKQRGACNNKRMVSSSNESDKCDIGATLSLEIQEASGTGGLHHY